MISEDTVESKIAFTLMGNGRGCPIALYLGDGNGFKISLRAAAELVLNISGLMNGCDS
jgi:hypothetical protein